MIAIYALVDPRDSMVYYVGISKHPEKRLLQHLSLKGRNQKKNKWLGELKAVQLVPELIILEEVASYKEAFKQEAHWTIYYARSRHPLTNLEHSRIGYSISEIGRADSRYWQQATN